MLALGATSIVTPGARSQAPDPAVDPAAAPAADPLATLITDLDIGIAARHAADAKGKFPGGLAVGAGPYRVDSITPDRVRLSVNRYWAGPPPALPKIDFKVVRDAAARIVMLAGGSADLVQNGIRYDLVDDVLARPRLVEQRGASTKLTYLMFNTRDPVLDDPRVRRALAMAAWRCRWPRPIPPRARRGSRPGWSRRWPRPRRWPGRRSARPWST